MSYGHILASLLLFVLDDILIFSRIEEEHLQNLRLRFKLLKQHALYAKERKCEFFVDEIHYLGHIFSQDGRRIDPKKVNKFTILVMLTHMVG